MPFYFLYGTPEQLDTAQRLIDEDKAKLAKVKAGGIYKAATKFLSSMGQGLVFEITTNREEKRIKIFILQPPYLAEGKSDAQMKDYRLEGMRLTKLGDGGKEVEL